MTDDSPATNRPPGLDLSARPQRELDLMAAELSARRTGLSFQRTRMSADRNFGLALVIFGILLLILGLWSHVKFMRGLRAERAMLVTERYLHGEESFPYSITLLIATLLLLLGLVAIINMVFRSGPFG